LPPFALDGVDETSVAVFRAFKTAFQLHRQLMDRTLAEKGTHPGEAMCLRLLGERDGMSQRDLAEILHLSRPRVTGILQDLERAGCVVRRPDEHDQRLTRVYVTTEGLRRAREFHTILAASLNETIGAMTEEDRRELERLLGILSYNTTRALESEGRRPER
jgi:DNA-binding MarR family transcriptional regulator